VFDTLSLTIAQETLVKKILKWPATQRVEFTEELLAGVQDFATPEIKAGWDAEVGARVKEIREGQATGMPAEAAMVEARKRLNEARRLSPARRRRTR